MLDGVPEASDRSDSQHLPSRLQDEGQAEKAESYFSEAEMLLQKAIAEDPASAQAYFIYARLLEARQQYDEAEVEYQQALGLDPTDGTIQAAYEGSLILCT